MAQAKVAFVLKFFDVIESAIAEPRPELAPTALRLTVFRFLLTRLRFVIGKGGETTDKIIVETGVTIDIDEEGLVQISLMIRMPLTVLKLSSLILVREAKVGEVYTVPVVRIEKVRCLCSPFNKTDVLCPHLVN